MESLLQQVSSLRHTLAELQEVTGCTTPSFTTTKDEPVPEDGVSLSSTAVVGVGLPFSLQHTEGVQMELARLSALSEHATSQLRWYAEHPERRRQQSLLGLRSRQMYGDVNKADRNPVVGSAAALTTTTVEPEEGMGSALRRARESEALVSKETAAEAKQESLGSIAQRLKVPLAELRELNPHVAGYSLDQVLPLNTILKVPATVGEEQGKPLPPPGSTRGVDRGASRPAPSESLPAPPTPLLTSSSSLKELLLTDACYTTSTTPSTATGEAAPPPRQKETYGKSARSPRKMQSTEHRSARGEDPFTEAVGLPFTDTLPRRKSLRRTGRRVHGAVENEESSRGSEQKGMPSPPTPVGHASNASRTGRKTEEDVTNEALESQSSAALRNKCGSSATQDRDYAMGIEELQPAAFVSVSSIRSTSRSPDPYPVQGGVLRHTSAVGLTGAATTARSTSLPVHDSIGSTLSSRSRRSFKHKVHHPAATHSAVEEPAAAFMTPTRHTSMTIEKKEVKTEMDAVPISTTTTRGSYSPIVPRFAWERKDSSLHNRTIVQITPSLAADDARPVSGTVAECSHPTTNTSSPDNHNTLTLVVPSSSTFSSLPSTAVLEDASPPTTTSVVARASATTSAGTATETAATRQSATMTALPSSPPPPPPPSILEPPRKSRSLAKRLGSRSSQRSTPAVTLLLSSTASPPDAETVQQGTSRLHSGKSLVSPHDRPNAAEESHATERVRNHHHPSGGSHRSGLARPVRSSPTLNTTTPPSGSVSPAPSASPSPALHYLPRATSTSNARGDAANEEEHEERSHSSSLKYRHRASTTEAKETSAVAAVSTIETTRSSEGPRPSLMRSFNPSIQSVNRIWRTPKVEPATDPLRYSTLSPGQGLRRSGGVVFQPCSTMMSTRIVNGGDSDCATCSSRESDERERSLPETTTTTTSLSSLPVSTTVAKNEKETKKHETKAEDGSHEEAETTYQHGSSLPHSSEVFPSASFPPSFLEVDSSPESSCLSAEPAGAKLPSVSPLTSPSTTNSPSASVLSPAHPALPSRVRTDSDVPVRLAAHYPLSLPIQPVEPPLSLPTSRNIPHFSSSMEAASYSPSPRNPNPNETGTLTSLFPDAQTSPTNPAAALGTVPSATTVNTVTSAPMTPRITVQKSTVVRLRTNPSPHITTPRSVLTTTNSSAFTTSSSERSHRSCKAEVSSSPSPIKPAALDGQLSRARAAPPEMHLATAVPSSPTANEGQTNSPGNTGAPHLLHPKLNSNNDGDHMDFTPPHTPKITREKREVPQPPPTPRHLSDFSVSPVNQGTNRASFSVGSTQMSAASSYLGSFSPSPNDEESVLHGLKPETQGDRGVDTTAATTTTDMTAKRLPSVPPLSDVGGAETSVGTTWGHSHHSSDTDRWGQAVALETPRRMHAVVQDEEAASAAIDPSQSSSRRCSEDPVMRETTVSSSNSSHHEAPSYVLLSTEGSVTEAAITTMECSSLPIEVRGDGERVFESSFRSHEKDEATSSRLGDRVNHSPPLQHSVKEYRHPEIDVDVDSSSLGGTLSFVEATPAKASERGFQMAVETVEGEIAMEQREQSDEEDDSEGEGGAQRCTKKRSFGPPRYASALPFPVWKLYEDVESGVMNSHAGYFPPIESSPAYVLSETCTASTLSSRDSQDDMPDPASKQQSLLMRSQKELPPPPPTAPRSQYPLPPASTTTRPTAVLSPSPAAVATTMSGRQEMNVGASPASSPPLLGSSLSPPSASAVSGGLHPSLRTRDRHFVLNSSSSPSPTAPDARGRSTDGVALRTPTTSSSLSVSPSSSSSPTPVPPETEHEVAPARNDTAPIAAPENASTTDVPSARVVLDERQSQNLTSKSPTHTATQATPASATTWSSPHKNTVVSTPRLPSSDIATQKTTATGSVRSTQERKEDRASSNSVRFTPSCTSTIQETTPQGKSGDEGGAGAMYRSGVSPQWFETPLATRTEDSTFTAEVRDGISSLDVSPSTAAANSFTSGVEAPSSSPPPPMAHTQTATSSRSVDHSTTHLEDASSKDSAASLRRSKTTPCEAPEKLGRMTESVGSYREEEDGLPCQLVGMPASSPPSRHLVHVTTPEQHHDVSTYRSSSSAEDGAPAEKATMGEESFGWEDDGWNASAVAQVISDQQPSVSLSQVSLLKEVECTGAEAEEDESRAIKRESKCEGKQERRPDHYLRGSVHHHNCVDCAASTSSVGNPRPHTEEDERSERERHTTPTPPPSSPRSAAAPPHPSKTPSTAVVGVTDQSTLSHLASLNGSPVASTGNPLAPPLSASSAALTSQGSTGGQSFTSLTKFSLPTMLLSASSAVSTPRSSHSTRSSAARDGDETQGSEESSRSGLFNSSGRSPAPQDGYSAYESHYDSSPAGKSFPSRLLKDVEKRADVEEANETTTQQRWPHLAVASLQTSSGTELRGFSEGDRQGRSPVKLNAHCPNPEDGADKRSPTSEHTAVMPSTTTVDRGEEDEALSSVLSVSLIRERSSVFSLVSEVPRLRVLSSISSLCPTQYGMEGYNGEDELEMEENVESPPDALKGTTRFSEKRRQWLARQQEKEGERYRCTEAAGVPSSTRQSLDHTTVVKAAQAVEGSHAVWPPRQPQLHPYEKASSIKGDLSPSGEGMAQHVKEGDSTTETLATVRQHHHSSFSPATAPSGPSSSSPSSSHRGSLPDPQSERPLSLAMALGVPSRHEKVEEEKTATRRTSDGGKSKGVLEKCVATPSVAAPQEERREERCAKQPDNRSSSHSPSKREKSIANTHHSNDTSDAQGHMKSTQAVPLTPERVQVKAKDVAMESSPAVPLTPERVQVKAKDVAVESSPAVPLTPERVQVKAKDVAVESSPAVPLTPELVQVKAKDVAVESSQAVPLTPELVQVKAKNLAVESSHGDKIQRWRVQQEEMRIQRVKERELERQAYAQQTPAPQERRTGETSLQLRHKQKEAAIAALVVRLGGYPQTSENRVRSTRSGIKDLSVPSGEETRSSQRRQRPSLAEVLAGHAANVSSSAVPLITKRTTTPSTHHSHATEVTTTTSPHRHHPSTSSSSSILLRPPMDEASKEARAGLDHQEPQRRPTSCHLDPQRGNLSDTTILRSVIDVPSEKQHRGSSPSRSVDRSCSSSWEIWTDGSPLTAPHQTASPASAKVLDPSSGAALQREHHKAAATIEPAEGRSTALFSASTPTANNTRRGAAEEEVLARPDAASLFSRSSHRKTSSQQASLEKHSQFTKSPRRHSHHDSFQPLPLRQAEKHWTAATSSSSSLLCEGKELARSVSRSNAAPLAVERAATLRRGDHRTAIPEPHSSSASHDAVFGGISGTPGGEEMTGMTTIMTGPSSSSSTSSVLPASLWDRRTAAEPSPARVPSAAGRVTAQDREVAANELLDQRSGTPGGRVSPASSRTSPTHSTPPSQRHLVPTQSSRTAEQVSGSLWTSEISSPSVSVSHSPALSSPRVEESSNPNLSAIGSSSRTTSPTVFSRRGAWKGPPGEVSVPYWSSENSPRTTPLIERPLESVQQQQRRPQQKDRMGSVPQQATRVQEHRQTKTAPPVSAAERDPTSHSSSDHVHSRPVATAWTSAKHQTSTAIPSHSITGVAVQRSTLSAWKKANHTWEVEQTVPTGGWTQHCETAEETAVMTTQRVYHL